MFRLVKEWRSGGICIGAGVCFKQRDGFLSNIPDDYLEEYVPEKYQSRKRKVKEDIVPTQSTQSIEQIARCASAKSFRGREESSIDLSE